MKKQLAIEFRRLLKSPTFYIALTIGLYIAISQVVEVSVMYAKANEEGVYNDIVSLPYSVFTVMMGMGSGSHSWHENMLINILPVLSALPFGVSFYLDKKSGYIKNLFIREEKGDYLWAKYIVTFMSGGIVSAFPILVNFIGNAMVLPFFSPIRGCALFGVAPDLLDEVYYSAPVLYILCICFIYFLIGGLLATMCLCVTYWVDIIFLVQLFPLMFVNIYNMCTYTFQFLGLQMLYSFLGIQHLQPLSAGNVIKLLVIMLVFSVIYFYNGYKEETL